MSFSFEEIERRRADSAFATRLHERIHEDAPLLARLAVDNSPHLVLNHPDFDICIHCSQYRKLHVNNMIFMINLGEPDVCSNFEPTSGSDSA